MSPDDELIEFTETCRSCMTKNSLVPIQEDLRVKFFESTSIMVNKDDGLPCYLCLDCLDTLNYAHQFKKGCLRVDSSLKKKLADLQNRKQNNQKKTLTKPKDSPSKARAGDSIKLEKVDSKGDEEDCYYVVIIKEDEKGEKTMQTVKVEASEDGGFMLPTIKQEVLLDDEPEEGQYMDPDPDPEPEPDAEPETVPSVEPDLEPVIEEDSLINPVLPVSEETAPQEEIQETEDNVEMHEVPLVEVVPDHQIQIMEDGQLSLIQVLSDNGESIDGNLIQYSDYVSEVPLTEDGAAYTQEEVVVGNGDEEYEIVCNGDDFNDEEETITVMQQLDGSFLCDCGEAYMDLGEYEEHSRTHNIYPCSVCGRQFESKKMAQGHSLLHSNDAAHLLCPFCNHLVQRNMLITHIKVNHSKFAAQQPTCPVCNKMFANENNLKRHMDIHSGEKKYECNVCGKRFNQRASMQNHRMLHARDLMGCRDCPATFSTAEELAEHAESCGAAEAGGGSVQKPFACLTCGKQYITMASLRSHIEYLHSSSQVELLCSECGEVLPSRKAMYAHAYTHRQAKVKNLKRFACSVCGKGCSSHAMLLMHERVHTNERPYKCQSCSLAFKTKTHLTTHQLTHTQEKRFGCSVCMKFFALKGNLVVHLRTHTGERPYVCSLCNQAFIDSKYLKKHKQRRHDIANIPWNQYY